MQNINGINYIRNRNVVNTGNRNYGIIDENNNILYFNEVGFLIYNSEYNAQCALTSVKDLYPDTNLKVVEFSMIFNSEQLED